MTPLAALLLREGIKPPRAKSPARKPAPRKPALRKPAPRKPAPRKPAPRKRTARVRIMSDERVGEILAQQKKTRQLARRAHRMELARGKFRPRKADLGTIVFVGMLGQRDPQKKNRAGFAVYVSSSGKKSIIRDVRGEMRPRKITDLQLPYRKNLKNKLAEFSARRLQLDRLQKPLQWLAGKRTNRKLGREDFGESMVRRIARDLRRALESSRDRRYYLVRGWVTVKVPGQKSLETFDFELEIARRDFVAIELGGLVNFVRQKFYAFMARRLAIAGYVSVGSANHIRKLNRGETDRSEWLDSRGEKWESNENEVVRIMKIEWKLFRLTSKTL